VGGEVVKVLERMRVSGVWSRDHGKRKVLGGGGLKMDKLGRWMKRQRQAYDERVLTARYRHVVEVLGEDLGGW